MRKRHLGLLLLACCVLFRLNNAAALPPSPLPPHATPTPAPLAPSLGVYRVCPDSGPLKGGTSITIIFDSFGLKGPYQVAGVKLGSQQATTFQPHSFNFSDRLEFSRLNISLPPLPRGSAAGKPLPLVVSLSNAKGTIAGQPGPFTYRTGSLPPGKPSVGGFSTAVVGPPYGEELVSIDGNNFTGDPACIYVNFGSTAMGVEQLTPSQWITATDPGDPLYPANNIVNVTVTTPGGTSDINFEDVFTYVAPMDVVSVNPTMPVDRDPRDGDQLLTDGNGFFWNPNWGANWYSTAALNAGVDPCRKRPGLLNCAP
jgi:IPT/TIG domain